MKQKKFRYGTNIFPALNYFFPRKIIPVAYITDSDSDSDIDTGKSTSLNTTDEEFQGRKKTKDKKRYFGDSTDEEYVPGKKKTKKNKKGQATKKKTPQTKKSNSEKNSAPHAMRCDEPTNPTTAAAAAAAALLSNASCARFLESVEAEDFSSVQEVTSTMPVTQEEFVFHDEKMTFDFPHF